METLLNELLSKIYKISNADFVHKDNKADGIQFFSNNDAIRLDRYYEFWRNQIRYSVSNNQLLSNGWAFSTLGGLSSFERHIRTNPIIRNIYYNKGGEIALTLEKISENLSNIYSLGGVMLYGYGNLFRESYFIEQAKILHLLKSQRIYLIDCSLFYHIFANSQLNPLRNIIKAKQIKTLLLDYLDDPNSRSSLVYARDDLNPTRPVLHLFLGNTFGNIEPNLLKSSLNNVVRAGDIVIGEYALHTEDFFKDTSDDYVTEMAIIATSELFSIPIDSVKARYKITVPDYKYIEIEFPDKRYDQPLFFKSMLRRNFSYTELTKGEYELISNESALTGTIKLDAFRRLSN